MRVLVRRTSPAGRRLVVPGLPFPFFPARPMNGVALRTPEQARAQLIADLDRGYICQPKLGGDRGGLAVFDDGQVLVQNRHGGLLHQTVKNEAQFVGLPACTFLDGEVMPGGLFYPFECLAWGGASLVQAPTSERERAAKLICLEIGVLWAFDSIREETVVKLRKNLPFCEGYVRKDKGAYPIGISATSETRQWCKLKW